MKVRVLGVLGMHRSGTSCLMGALEQAGVSVGTVTRKSVGNPHGNREIVAVWSLHEQLLKANGGNWRDPPQAIIWRARDKAARDEIVRLNSKGHQFWGFKDPRLVFTLDGWLEAYPQMELVGAFRHPLAVAASLANRDGMRRSEGIRIWRCYNERLLRIYSERGPFPLIPFDVPEEEYAGRVNGLLARLGLQPVQGFFDVEARHHVFDSDSALPAECRELYARLLARAG